MILKKESYDLVGLLFEVHNNLGGGFLEIIYKDALEYELNQKQIKFEREKEFIVHYKDIILPHKFYADFVVFDKVILEVKSVKEFNSKHIAQCINYLKVSGKRLCILVNFQNESMEFKRVVL
jgi:GxxExxY protein